MPRSQIPSAILVCSLLAGCGNNTLASSSDKPIPNASMGGLPYANGSQTLADAEGETMRVRLARFETDGTTGNTRLVVSNEFVTLAAGDYVLQGANKTITFNTETIEFVDGLATLANGQEMRSYESDSGTFSAIFGIHSYSDGNTQIETLDTEAFYAWGFETDPDTITADTRSTVTYTGTFSGFGQILTPDGSIISREVATHGDISFSADFSQGTISGKLDGIVDYTDPLLGEPIDFTAIIAEVDINRNGFDSELSFDCRGGSTCSSASEIGGLFYGPKGEELTGVVLLDETIDDPRMTGAINYVGAAGFLTYVDIAAEN